MRVSAFGRLVVLETAAPKALRSFSSRFTAAVVALAAPAAAPPASAMTTTALTPAVWGSGL